MNEREAIRLLRAADHGLLVFTGERTPPDGSVQQEATLEIRAAAIDITPQRKASVPVAQ